MNHQPEHMNDTTNPNRAPASSAEAQTVRLLAGFDIQNGYIVQRDSGRRIADESIDVLHLSPRSLNALLRAKRAQRQGREPIQPMRLSELLHYSQEDLHHIRGLGITSVNEIIEKAQRYLYDQAAVPRAWAAGQYQATDAGILHTPTGSLLGDAHVSALRLSKRPYNGLVGRGIQTVSALLRTSREECLSIPNLGPKSIQEIDVALGLYLDNALALALPSYTPQVMPVALPSQTALIPAYSLWQEGIIHGTTFRWAADAPLSVLGLGERAASRLRRAGIERISDVLMLTRGTLEKSAWLGKKGMNEVLAGLEAYLENQPLAYLSPPGVGAGQPWRCTPQHIQELYSKAPFAQYDLDTLRLNLPQAMDSASITDCIQGMAMRGDLMHINGRYSSPHPGYLEVLEQRALSAAPNSIDARMVFTLTRRAQGMTLDDIGTQLGITRERVRQIESRGQRTLLRALGVVAEDRYRVFYETYRAGRDALLAMGYPYALWYYLSILYRMGTQDIEQAIDDVSLPADIRRSVLNWMQQDHIQVQGDFIRRQRAAIEDHILETYCRDEVTLDAFFAMYTDFLRQHALQGDDKLALNASNLRTRENRLANAYNVLWKQNRRLRYYDIASTDVSLLYSELNLVQYQNTALSTRLLMLQHADLMEVYDIRDEYELHNLIKKTDANGMPGVDYGRMPMLQFGHFDRDAAVREILFMTAPISVEGLVALIAEEYGARENTIRANWFSGIDAYYHQGMYTIHERRMTDEHQWRLGQQLTEDFYFLSEVRDIYRKTVPDADVSLVTPYNLKLLGFKVNASYAYRNYPSADAYFRHLLSGRDHVDAEAINRRLGGLPAYTSCLNQMKATYEIVEHEPLRYVTLRWLAAHGVPREALSAFCDRVYGYTSDDQFFTMKHLRRLGFDAFLNVPFGDWFYNSLLRVDSRFTYLRLKNNILLCRSPQPFVAETFLTYLVAQSGSIALDALLRLLVKDFGIQLLRHEVLSHVRASGLQYDRIEDVVALV